MNQNTNKPNQQGQKKESHYIKVEPQSFDGELNSKLISTFDLCKKINEMFRPVFSDYVGCIIFPNQNGKLETWLSFEDRPEVEGKLKAIEPLVKKDINSLSNAERVLNINNMFKNKTYELTEISKEILEEFITPQSNSKKIKWDRIYFEQTVQNMYNRGIINVYLTDLDLIKLIKKIYGSKVDGNRVDYQVTMQRPISNNVDVNSREFLIKIDQLNTKQVEGLFEKLGMAPNVNGMVPIVRA